MSLEPNLAVRVRSVTAIAGGRIAIVGEAPGQTEIEEGQPFCGNAGVELSNELARAGIIRTECHITNVFDFKLPANDIGSICGNKKSVGGRDYSHPPIAPGKYLKPEYFASVLRLREELTTWNPNVVIALGNTALWALCGHGKVGTYRGAVAESTLIPGLKVLPTYHPAAILRSWGFRTLAITDLIKARKESAFSEIRRIRRELWIEPTLEDLVLFQSAHIPPASVLSVDIETARNSHLTCVGFAPSPLIGICVPFVDKTKPGFHYWSTPEDEITAWRWCRELLETNYCVIGQNFGGYDIQWLYREAGIRTQGYRRDSMHRWHALQPEMPRKLGFLTSVFTNETAHKVFNPNVGKDQLKREA